MFNILKKILGCFLFILAIYSILIFIETMKGFFDGSYDKINPIWGNIILGFMDLKTWSISLSIICLLLATFFCVFGLKCFSKAKLLDKN